jgi:hypothetical protein
LETSFIKSGLLERYQEVLQMLELSQVRPRYGDMEVEVEEAAGLQFQDTLRALGQLTCLQMSDVKCRNVLPPKKVGNLTNLRYIHMYYVLLDRTIRRLFVFIVWGYSKFWSSQQRKFYSFTDC